MTIRHKVGTLFAPYTRGEYFVVGFGKILPKAFAPYTRGEYPPKNQAPAVIRILA